MAQRIYGIDLGAHLVKVAVLEVGFRQSALKQVVSVPVADYAGAALPESIAAQEAFAAEEIAGNGGTGEGAEEPEAASAHTLPREPLPNFAAVLAALDAALHRAGGRPDLAALALPGDLVSFRVLEFPFSDPKKVAAVLSYELEGQIPYDIDEVVHDHLLSRGDQGDGRALVTLAHVERTGRLLDLLERGTGLAPAVVTVGPLGYGYLLEAEGEAGASREPVAVLDIGHAHTNLAVHRGLDVVLARTLSRGGANITRALAERYQVDEQRAAEIKHTYAQLPAPGGAVVSGDRAPIVEVVQQEIAPLVRAVRQSLLGLRQHPELSPTRLILCGGGSSIQGLPEHLQQELELPVETRLPPQAPTGVGARGQVLAVGLAQLAADRRRPQVNLRQGPLGLREERSLFRKRALYFSWAAVLMVGLLVLNGFVSLWTLRKEEENLRNRLAHTTLEIFGKPMNDVEMVEGRISHALQRRKVSTLPIPDVSAYAVLSEISRRVPAKDKVTLDITRIYIREGKIDLEGTAKDAKQVESVVEALKKIPCFKKVQQGRVSEVTVREMIDDQVKTDKRRKFTVDIAHDCI